MNPFFPRLYIAQRAADHGVTVEQLHSYSRKHDLVEARANIARELRARDMTYPRIGALLNRDHSTIIHYMRRAG